MVSRHVLILLAGLCADAVARGATIAVSPPSGAGRPGGALRLEGSGFDPAAAVTIPGGEAPVVPASLTANADSNFSAPVAACRLYCSSYTAGYADLTVRQGAIA